MRKIKTTKQYKKSYKRCLKRGGFPLQAFEYISQILVTRPFTQDEVYNYKVHKLQNSRKYKDCWELHIDGSSGDWLLIYKLLGDSVRFEDVIVEYNDIGTHSDCFGEIDLTDDLVIL